MIYLLVTFAVMILAVMFAPPITYSKNLSGTRNASNNLVRIVMRKNLGKYASAIWAQEYYEIKLKKRHIIKAITRNKKFIQDMEIMGHEIETQVAFLNLGADAIQYRDSEAQALTRYKQFKGFTKAEIHSRMVAASPKAIEFVSANKSKIAKARKYE